MTMTTTHVSSLDNTIHKTNIWLKELREELHTEDPQFAYQSLRAVLTSLRDRLTVEEAADLAAQLPLLVRGIFYDGWKPAGKPVKIRSREAFLESIAEKIAQPGPVDAGRISTAVFNTLKKRISEGEIGDVRSNLPQDIQDLWAEAA